jgi:hypothetical protein
MLLLDGVRRATSMMSRTRPAETGRLRYARAERRSEMACVTAVMRAASKMVDRTGIF